MESRKKAAGTRSGKPHTANSSVIIAEEPGEGGTNTGLRERETDLNNVTQKLS